MKNKTYIIGEIRQNYNGSVDIAKLMVDNAVIKIVDESFNSSSEGIDAIKLNNQLDYISFDVQNKPSVLSHCGLFPEIFRVDSLTTFSKFSNNEHITT